MPDFDVDFCSDGRDRWIDYVRRNTGINGIRNRRWDSAHGGESMVVRDVGRVIGMELQAAGRKLAKLSVPAGTLITLQMGLREWNPRLREREESRRETRELGLALAGKLEGVKRERLGHARRGVVDRTGQAQRFIVRFDTASGSPKAGVPARHGTTSRPSAGCESSIFSA